MQTLDVISVNLWDIVISLLNLTILFLLVKKFLFKPVMRVISERQSTIDRQYENARLAEEKAREHEDELSERLGNAKKEAAEIIKGATESAAKRGEEIVADAKEKASGIVAKAQSDAELERKKAEAEIKTEIVEVASALSEKVLGRKITDEDHRSLIDSVIEGLGDKK